MLSEPDEPARQSTSEAPPGVAWLSLPVRFLIAGGFNTLWGYSSFALLYFSLAPRLHYFIILTIANVINVTVSYITYKLFVFGTEGNFVREYLRFYAVNAVPIVLGYVLFPLLTGIFHVNPYLAQALILCITVIVSYFGHKHISFARARPCDAPADHA